MTRRIRHSIESWNPVRLLINGLKSLDSGFRRDDGFFEVPYSVSAAKSANRERSPRRSVTCAECSHGLKRSTA
jgi:hypothetical protein